MDIAEVQKIAQRCFQASPTIVLGSGASIPHGLPNMADLQEQLLSDLAPSDEPDRKVWAAITDRLASGDHLEQALEGMSLSTELTDQIVRITWARVVESDRALFMSLHTSRPTYPLGHLLIEMFRSTQRHIDVVTTNYDRVVEYACNSVGLLFYTGFTPGYSQRWTTADRIEYCQASKPARVVNIWKVHGSLDWFQTLDKQTVGVPTFEPMGDELVPLIVTPGLDKYRKTYGDPFRDTLQGADTALKQATAFLCAGYGFRDEHIHPKIITRCRDASVPIVVLAKALTDEAKDFLANDAGSNFLGIEETASGSRVFCPSQPAGIEFNVKGLWTLDGFLSMIKVEERGK